MSRRSHCCTSWRQAHAISSLMAHSAMARLARSSTTRLTGRSASRCSKASAPRETGPRAWCRKPCRSQPWGTQAHTCCTLCRQRTQECRAGPEQRLEGGPRDGLAGPCRLLLPPCILRLAACDSTNVFGARTRALEAPDTPGRAGLRSDGKATRCATALSLHTPPGLSFGACATAGASAAPLHAAQATLLLSCCCFKQQVAKQSFTPVKHCSHGLHTSRQVLRAQAAKKQHKSRAGQQVSARPSAKTPRGNHPG